MRHPPPVSVRCGGGRAWRWAVVALQALAAAGLARWLAGLSGAAGVVDAAVPLAIGAGLLVLAVARPWRLPPPVVLTWDGSSWSADGTLGDLQVALDLGPWMLLRLRPEAGTGRGLRRWRWLPVAAAEAGPSWHALRVAAHAAAPARPALADPPHV